MRNRMIALLAGLMVLGIAGTALAAPSVDRMVDLDLSYDEGVGLYYKVTEDTETLATDTLAIPDDYTINHGQLLKLWKTSLKEKLVEWSGGWGCLISAFAGTDIGKKGDDGTIGDFELTTLETKCKEKADGDLSPGQLKKQERPERTEKGKPPWAGPKD